jgi:hypothetical protein
MLVVAGLFSGMAMAEEKSDDRFRGVYLGLWADPDKDPQGHMSPERSIEVREGAAPDGIIRTFALHLHYYEWTQLVGELVSGKFQPDNELLGDIDHQRVPVISWKCDDTGVGTNTDALIAHGDPSEEAVILKTAAALKQYPGPVILRWFWEFNVFKKNFGCRGDSGGAPSQQVYDDFIHAWRRIRFLFRLAHADNVIFLWNPGIYSFEGAQDDPHSFYPGNDFVDWIGVDTYQHANETFADDFDLFYNDFTDKRYGDKPLMVGENGALPYDETGVEQQWSYLLGLLADVQGHRYPKLIAYDYFERGRDVQNWVLDDNNGHGNGGLAALAIVGASPQFSPTRALGRDLR